MSNLYQSNQPWSQSHQQYPLQLEQHFNFGQSQEQQTSQFNNDPYRRGNLPYPGNQGNVNPDHPNGVGPPFYTAPASNSTTTNVSYYHPSYNNSANPDISSFPFTSLSADMPATSLNGITNDPTSFTSSPLSMQQPFPQQSPPQPYPSRPSATSGLGPSPKRQRPFESAGDKDDPDPEVQRDATGAKVKAPGACARCKNLKVKCEAKTETDPCKRCLNGGHACVIPGRKKRRTPPKREHLLNQIRDQAAQIQKLMAQLENSNRRTTSDTHSHQDGLTPISPMLSPSSSHESELDDPIFAARPSANQDVIDWISKARESIEAFGGFIGMGGASMPRGFLVKEDPEDSESTGDEDGYNSEGENTMDFREADTQGDEYEFGVVDSDGDDALRSEQMVERDTGRSVSQRQTTDPRKPVRRQPSTASSTGTGHQATPRKKDSGSEKLATLPTEASPWGLMADLSLKKGRRRQSSADEPSAPASTELGVANADFFRASPGPDQATNRDAERQAPHILTRSIVTPEEAEKLFEIFYNYMNLSVSLLDPVLYTPQMTCYRSSFLFTVICAIASRYYTKRPELYNQAMHYAQLAAGTALIGGQKSVEVVHGYLLLSLYPMPVKRWEEDRSWLYLGLAIRVATDLNLHHPNTAKPLNEQHEREMLNRTRAWLNCFNLDRSIGSQHGKAPVIKDTDYIANYSGPWWNSFQYNMKDFDIHISAYNEALRASSKYRASVYSDPRHPTGLNKDANFEALAMATDDELVRLGEKWFKILQDNIDHQNPQSVFRTDLIKLAYSYQRLVALSYGFQHAFGKNNTNENPFLLRCLRAAEDVVHAVVNGKSSQTIYLRHGPEGQSVFLTFASAFLVKLLQPKYSSYLTTEQRLDIRALVQKVVDLLGSPEVAIDSQHGPKLYSRFLEGLLATPMAKVDYSLSTTRRQLRRSKSVTSQPAGTELTADIPIIFSADSPSNGDLPPLAGTSLTFNGFAPISPEDDPFAHDSVDSFALNMDYFQPPLAFDSEILQSMQSLTDWQDVSLPGFNWMSQLQSPVNANDITMTNIPVS